MLSGENVRVLGALLAQRLRLAFQAYQQQNSVKRENAQNCEEEPAPYLPTTLNRTLQKCKFRRILIALDSQEKQDRIRQDLKN